MKGGRGSTCPKGHRKAGDNLAWKTVRGKRYAACRRCQNDQASAYYQRSKTVPAKGKKARARGRRASDRSLPLGPRPMDMLMGLHQSPGLGPESYARLELMELSVAYVMLSRLAVLGLAESKMVWEPDPSTGRKVNRAYYELTANGRRLADAWVAFKKSIGPEVAKIIGVG